DRDLALQASEPRLFGRIVCGGDFLVERLVHHRVDAADEKARDTRYFVRVAALGDVFLETGDVGFGDLGVDLLRDKQCDVDVDTLGEHRPDRWQPGCRARSHQHQTGEA